MNYLKLFIAPIVLLSFIGCSKKSNLCHKWINKSMNNVFDPLGFEFKHDSLFLIGYKMDTTVFFYKYDNERLVTAWNDAEKFSIIVEKISDDSLVMRSEKFSDTIITCISDDLVKGWLRAESAHELRNEIIGFTEFSNEYLVSRNRLVYYDFLDDGKLICIFYDNRSGVQEEFENFLSWELLYIFNQPIIMMDISYSRFYFIDSISESIIYSSAILEYKPKEFEFRKKSFDISEIENILYEDWQCIDSNYIKVSNNEILNLPLYINFNEFRLIMIDPKRYVKIALCYLNHSGKYVLFDDKEYSSIKLLRVDKDTLELEFLTRQYSNHRLRYVRDKSKYNLHIHYVD